jgi:hypothetical protein
MIKNLGSRSATVWDSMIMDLGQWPAIVWDSMFRILANDHWSNPLPRLSLFRRHVTWDVSSIHQRHKISAHVLRLTIAAWSWILVQDQGASKTKWSRILLQDHWSSEPRDHAWIICPIIKRRKNNLYQIGGRTVRPLILPLTLLTAETTYFTY